MGAEACTNSGLVFSRFRAEMRALRRARYGEHPGARGCGLQQRMQRTAELLRWEMILNGLVTENSTFYPNKIFNTMVYVEATNRNKRQRQVLCIP